MPALRKHEPGKACQTLVQAWTVCSGRGAAWQLAEENLQWSGKGGHLRTMFDTVGVATGCFSYLDILTCSRSAIAVMLRACYSPKKSCPSPIACHIVEHGYSRAVWVRVEGNTRDT